MLFKFSYHIRTYRDDFNCSFAGFIYHTVKQLSCNPPSAVCFINIRMLNSPSAVIFFVRTFSYRLNSVISRTALSSNTIVILPPNNYVSKSSLNRFSNFRFGIGYFEIRCSKSCCLCNLELANLFASQLLNVSIIYCKFHLRKKMRLYRLSGGF